MTAREQNRVITRLYWSLQNVGGALQWHPGEVHETKGQLARRAKSAVFWRNGVTIGLTSTILPSRLVGHKC